MPLKKHSTDINIHIASRVSPYGQLDGRGLLYAA